MRFEQFQLYKKIKTGEDTLGNPVNSDVLLGTFPGRFTQWSADDVSVLGRDFTASNRKVLTRASKSQCKIATKIHVDSTDYKITSVCDLGRWRLLYVKGHRI